MEHNRNKIMMTIRDLFDRAVSLNTDRNAQIYYHAGEWKSRTYGELRSRILSLAHAFREFGFVPGKDNIAIMSENCPEWQETYLALAGVGITVVPIDPKLKSREVLHILNDSGAVAIFAGVKQIDTITEIINELPALKICVSMQDGDMVPRDGFPLRLEDYGKLMVKTVTDDDEEWFMANRPKDSTLASLIYTSGTTGVPKGVMLTHGNFVSDAIAAVEAVKFNKDDNYLAVLPFFHTYAFTGNMLLPLAEGGCTSFIRSLKTVSEDMKYCHPTVLLAVPLLAEKIYAKLDANIKASFVAKILFGIGLGGLIGKKFVKALGGKLRFIGIGGAPASREVLKGFTRVGIPILEGYGLTECSPLVAYPTLGNYRIGTVGRVLPIMDYKIADKDESGAGELCVRGPNVMKGYYNNPEATAAIFDDEGFMHTGDIVREDDEKNIEICGRCKALIVNREGKNIYPEEIEQVVGRSEYVKESLSLGYTVQDEVGERVGLIIEADDEACQVLGATEQERDEKLIAHIARICKEKLAKYKIPRKIVIRHKPFTLTSTMKVKRVKYNGTLDENNN